MMKDMDKKGDLPLSLLATIGQQKGGSASPRQASSSAPATYDSSRHVVFRVLILHCASVCGTARSLNQIDMGV